ncbi:MAG: divergent polysaccharide deacetylase family protein [Candidatus Hydrogenedentes bacterium]|nr:divergent polysaccharide deacetylase family protein [Candidatus Hydrogenedentota bacterium]
MSAAERTERFIQTQSSNDVPNPWGALLALACFILIASAIGIGLMERYLDTRLVYAGTVESTVGSTDGADFARADAAGEQHTDAPSLTLARYEERNDLTSKTSRIADTIETALRGAGSVYVRAAHTELRQSDTTLWQYTVLHAQFPNAFATSDLTPRLAMAVVDDSVRIEPITGAPSGQTWLSVRYHGIECATVRAFSDVTELPEFKLAALAVEWSGLNPDDIVQEFFPDPESLPLDSTDFKIDAPTPSSTPPRPYTGPLRLAIIVDDGGYGGWITEEILALPNTLTLSILPHAPYSYETAQRATELGFEVMLHMPMENVSGKTTYPGEITVTMDENEMLDLTNQALSDVPGAVGINNHTGSKFTSNAEAMRTWLDLIKERGYFFIDSRTSRYACAFEVADEMEIPSAENDLFLDHHAGPDYIRARFKQVIEMVKRHGQAIAICHFRKNTVPILKAMMPQFEKEGIEIVHASTLVR